MAGSFPNSTRFKYVRYNIYFESVGFGYNEENKVCRKLSQRFDHRQKTLDSSGESTYSRCRGVAYMYIFVIKFFNNYSKILQNCVLYYPLDKLNHLGLDKVK